MVGRNRGQKRSLKPFDQLSNRGQQRRLRTLAQQALARYDLPPHSLHALLHRENTTFRVDLASGERLVLRISKPSARLAAVHSETLWLQSLRRHTDLIIPDPPARPRGQPGITTRRRDSAATPRLLPLQMGRGPLPQSPILRHDHHRAIGAFYGRYAQSRRDI